MVSALSYWKSKDASEWLLFNAGEYFIAELIESQDEDHHTVVAEVCQLVYSG